jgi:trimeric autotransporter adhesin
MSTKTTFKRIALVAVAALGTGVLTSIAPANAAVTVSQNAYTVRTDDVNYAINPAAAGGLTVATITIAEAADNDLNGAKIAVKYQSTSTATAVAITGDPADVAAGGATSYATLTGNVRLGANPGANQTFAGTLAAGVLTVAAASGDNNDGAITLEVGRGALPGIYTLENDANGDGDITDAGDSTKTITVTGAPSTIRVVGAVSGISTETATATGDTDYTVSVRDASLRSTYLLATESISLTENGTGISVTLPVVAGITSGELNSDGANGRSTTARLAIGGSAVSGTYTLTATPNAALTALGVVAATGTLIYTLVSGEQDTLNIKMTSPTSQISGSATEVATPTVTSVSDGTDGVVEVFTNTTNTSFTFRLKAAAAATGNVTYTIARTNLVTSPAAGSYSVALIQDATNSYADVTVNVSSVTANSGFFTITTYEDGDGEDAAIKVSFKTPVAAAIDFAAPTNTATIASAFAGSTTLTALVTDQYENPLPNQALVFNRPASRNGAAAFTVVSNATGTASATFTDASTSTLAGSDAIYVGTSALTSDPGVMGDLVTIYYASNVTPATVAKFAASSGGTEVLADGTTKVIVDPTATAGTTTDEALLQVKVTNSAGVAIQGAAVVFSTSNGFVANAAQVAVDAIFGETTVTVYTDASGLATGYVAATKVGPVVFTATSGTASTSVTLNATYPTTTTDLGRYVSVSVTGDLVSATVTDGFGNVVPSNSVTLAASGGTFLTGSNTVTATTGANGIATAKLAAGTDVTVKATIAGTQATALVNVPVYGWTKAVASATSAAVSVGQSKSAELLASEANAAAIAAIAAKAASDKAETDAKIKLLEAQIAAAQAASVAAAEAAADAAAEAIDAGNNAYDAATSAGEAADAATAAAEQAGEDATAAANAAGAAAVAAAEAATEAAAEATDAANAATDAANASAEAADAATAAAQDAADAVAALSTQVSEMITALKKQITALTNLVIKIQKKVKA